MKKFSILLSMVLLVSLISCDDSDETKDVTITPNPISTFDDLTLSTGSYWDGSDSSGGFSSGNAYFVNNNPGGYWDGWAYSNMADTTTADYTNQYSAYTGSGHESDNYAVCYYSTYEGNHTQIYFGGKGSGDPAIPLSFYVTNTTYAYLSMLNGDDYGPGKKFGNSTNYEGDDDGTNGEDWFLLTIHGLNENYAQTGDTVEFYLADYRFSDSADDYIVNEWTLVDLSGLGEVYGLEFVLTSSDVGSWGINTPAYFAIDNLVLVDND